MSERFPKCRHCGSDLDSTAQQEADTRWFKWGCGTWQHGDVDGQSKECRISELEERHGVLQDDYDEQEILLREMTADRDRLYEENVGLKIELSPLRAWRNKLPHTIDGVPVQPGMTVYLAFGEESWGLVVPDYLIGGGHSAKDPRDVTRCYSSREAALEAVATPEDDDLKKILTDEFQRRNEEEWKA